MRMRTDGKFTIEGRILHPNGTEIPEDEPIFIMRARDRLALQTLRVYLKICKAHGCTTYQMEDVKKVMFTPSGQAPPTYTYLEGLETFIIDMWMEGLDRTKLEQKAKEVYRKQKERWLSRGTK
jgi:hypothetical protein